VFECEARTELTSIAGGRDRGRPGCDAVFHPVCVLEHLTGTSFCWLDICGGDDTERTDLLAESGLKTDVVWVQRFGQAGRLTIGRQRLRAVTGSPTPQGSSSKYTWCAIISVF